MRMFAKHFMIAAAITVCSTALTAQTHGQLLERAIFAEETVGDLDAAIRIYGRLVSAPGVPPEVLARSQRRLAEARRQREATMRATAIAARQSKPPVGLPGRIDSPPQAPPVGGAPAPLTARQSPDGCCGIFSDNYSAGSAVTVSGKIARIELLYPESVIYVEGDDGNRWGFTVASANEMVRSGWTRNKPKLGELVVVYGYVARGTGDCPAPLPNACATLNDGAFHASASTITRENTTIFDRMAVEQQEQERRKAAAGGR
jgi:hypothetical protein